MSTSTLPEQLWLGTQQTRQDILQTAFVKGIKDANLDPVKFCQYTIQDAIYVYKSWQSITQAEARSSPGPVKDMLKLYSTEYDSYVDAMFNRPAADSAVIVGKACRDYYTYENTVATTKSPIYLLVALLPCLRTWSWIGQQLESANKGIYRVWAKNNFTGSSWSSIEAAIQTAYENSQISLIESQEVYNKCMDYERQFFDSIRNQSF